MIFSSGLISPEGPVALPDGSWLIVEGGPERGSITHISPNGQAKSIVAKTGRPNGLAVDKTGTIWAAESKVPSLIRVTMDGKVEVVATACDSEPFLFPNDLCFGPDGALYMTDSGVHIDEFAPGGKIRPDYLDIRMDGRVYRIDPTTGQPEKLDAGIRFTNGIAFGPDKCLYASETVTGAIYRYAFQGGRVTGPRHRFGDVNDPAGPPGWRGPDGMAFGADGRLYVAVFGQKDVTVLNAEGVVVARIGTQGILPTNLAFGLPGQRKIYVTEYEFGQLEVFDVETDGLSLWQGGD
jgi:gluconolactonase